MLIYPLVSFDFPFEKFFFGGSRTTADVLTVSNSVEGKVDYGLGVISVWLTTGSKVNFGHMIGIRCSFRFGQVGGITIDFLPEPSMGKNRRSGN